METFIELFKERFRRPFSSAFIFSWLVINWQVWVIIFKYSSDKYNIIELIKENINLCNGLLYPFLSSMGFLFLVGFVNTLTDKYRKRWFIEKQKYINKEEELKNELNMKSMEAKLTYDIKLMENPTNKSLLNGYWQLTITERHPDPGIFQAIIFYEINQGQITFKKALGNEIVNDCLLKMNHILHLYYNEEKKILIIFCQYYNASAKKYEINSIEFDIIRRDEYFKQAVNLGERQCDFQLLKVGEL